MISNRMKSITEVPNCMYAGWKKCHEEPYHPVKNSTGTINLGVSENKLVEKEIMEKLLTINFEDFDVSLTHYCNLAGIRLFREGLTQFFNTFMKPKCELNADDVFVMNGCGTVIESLSATICDENDAFLVPAPYYSTFKQDLEARFNAKLVPIQPSKYEQKPFELTKAKLENAFNSAFNDGIQVRGLLISNPINPLGTVYPTKELQTCLDFCYINNIHLVCDEVYSLSVYDKEETFTNILSMKNIEKYKDIVHVVWGFSKDFGLSGFRCGVVITFNKEMKKALTHIAYYTSVPTSTQFVLNKVITDTDWIRGFQETNHKRLKVSRDLVVRELTKAGVGFVFPTGGLFLSFNVGSYMSVGSFEEEKELYEQFLMNGIFLLPGRMMEFREPGWFRIIISCPRDTMQCALERIVRTLQHYKRDFKHCVTTDKMTQKEL